MKEQSTERITAEVETAHAEISLVLAAIRGGGLSDSETAGAISVLAGVTGRLEKIDGLARG